MKALTFLLGLLFVSACASEKPKFVKEEVCSNQALKYLRNPRNKYKRALTSPQLIQDMARTSKSMQQCYEDFKTRSGEDEFNTCLVVGVDQLGQMEFFNFSSQEISLDQKFLSCAQAVTQTIPFSTYGANYIFVQAYKFYVGEI